MILSTLLRGWIGQRRRDDMFIELGDDVGSLFDPSTISLVTNNTDAIILTIFMVIAFVVWWSDKSLR